MLINYRLKRQNFWTCVPNSQALLDLDTLETTYVDVKIVKLYHQDIVTRLVGVPEISLAEVFITACAKGRLDLVADCLARGVEVNTVHPTRWRWGVRGTALTLAAERNDAELLELLLVRYQLCFMFHLDPGSDNNDDKSGYL